MLKVLDPMWYAARCLAGEAGSRVAEIRALDWRRDVDLVAGTITVDIGLVCEVDEVDLAEGQLEAVPKNEDLLDCVAADLMAAVAQRAGARPAENT